MGRVRRRRIGTPRVLVAPLDWGLGHAARCVPIIRHLTDCGARVFIGGAGRALALLQGEFPGLPALKLPAYQATYSSGNRMAVALIKQLPGFAAAALSEHSRLNRLARAGLVDAVVSDARFGLWSSLIPCVFITNQLFVRAPGGLTFTQPLMNGLLRSVIHKYDECWIPDVPGEDSLAGDLIEGGRPPRNLHYIGVLSRLCRPPEHSAGRVKVLALLSGPEPQRTLLEDILLEQLQGFGEEAALLRGKPEGAGEMTTQAGVRLFNHLPSEKLAALLEAADVVLARPGFGTLSDCAYFGKRCVFIPTPGQTEQLYLAARAAQRGWAVSAPQSRMDISSAVQAAQNARGLPTTGIRPELLRAAVQRLLNAAGLRD